MKIEVLIPLRTIQCHPRIGFESKQSGCPHPLDGRTRFFENGRDCGEQGLWLLLLHFETPNYAHVMFKGPV